MKIIRSSRHTIKFSNKEKLKNINSLINEYRRCASVILDYLWEHEYKWISNDISHTLDIKHNKLDCPKFVKVDVIKNSGLETNLTARLLKSCSTQVCGMISAEVEKQKKRLIMLKRLKENGESRKSRKSLIRKIKQNIPIKPNCNNINPEINSLCCNIRNVQNGEFDAFIQLTSITKNKLSINIPIKFHRHSNKLRQMCETQCKSISISKKDICIRYEYPNTPAKTDGVIAGADQGLKTVLTLSNHSTSPECDNHGHTLESILKKMSRKKKGSKAFKRVQEHRKNFINWSINNIDISDIKELRLEKIWNIRYRSSSSRILSHWSNPLIRDKVKSLCQLTGVRVIEQSCTYRSQRCSGCGLVRKSNRKGKIYSCEHCGLIIDADLNAACNHEINLPEIPYELRKMNKNRSGFFWLETGFYHYSSGRSLQSLPPVEDKFVYFD